MNQIDVSGPPWLIDVAEPIDLETIVSDLRSPLDLVSASQSDGQPHVGEPDVDGPDVTVVVRAVDDRCDDLLEPLGLVPHHDRWVQTLTGPGSRSDLTVRQGREDDLADVVEVCSRSRTWGETDVAEPDAANLAAAIAEGWVWVHERKGRLACALVLTHHEGSGLRTIERLAALSSPDDPYTGPTEDLERSLALQTLKATLWTLTGHVGSNEKAQVSGVQVSVAADHFDGVALFEAAKLRYRHTDRFYRRTGS